MSDLKPVDLARDFGRLEGEVKAMHRELGEAKAQIANLAEKVGDLTAALNQAKGGKKILILVAAAASAFGAFLVKVLPFLNP